MRLCQNELAPDPHPLCGVQTIADAELAGGLRETRRTKPSTWLAEHAPEGYEFVRTDAVDLRPLLDLTAEVVTVDAVVQAAAERGDALPADRLAASHVRRSRRGDWYRRGRGLQLVGPLPDCRASGGRSTGRSG